MTEGEPRLSLKDIIAQAGSEEELYDLLEQHLPPDQKAVFDQGAGQKIGEAIEYLAVFAPSPATFDVKAFQAVAMQSEAEAQQSLDILEDLGILRTAQSGRYEIVDGALMEKIRSIMPQ